MAKCSCSNTIIYIVNTIFFILGGAITGLATWGVKHSDDIKEVIPKGGAYTAMGVGVVLMLISLVGCAGAKFNQSSFGRCLLCLYSIVMVILIIAELAAAGLVLTATGKLSKYKDADKVNKKIDNWINKTYTECCPGAVPADRACWLSKETDIVNANTCSNEAAFRTNLVHWMNKRLTPMGIVLAVVAFIQLLTMIATWCSMHGGKKDAKEAKAKEEAYGYLGIGDVERGGHQPSRAPRQGENIRY